MHSGGKDCASMSAAAMTLIPQLLRRFGARLQIRVNPNRSQDIGESVRVGILLGV